MNTLDYEMTLLKLELEQRDSTWTPGQCNLSPVYRAMTARWCQLARRKQHNNLIGYEFQGMSGYTRKQ